MEIPDIRLQESNTQWESPELFYQYDKHLKDLRKNKYVFDYKLDKQALGPGIFLLFGGRQVGKSTAMKLMLQKLLENKELQPEQSIYINCDLLVERVELERSLRSFYTSIKREDFNIVMIDEVCRLQDWQLTIKAIIDLGWTQKSTVILTGSDKILLEEGAQGFPGIDRRGVNGKDIYIHPLNFKQYMELVSVDPSQEYEKLMQEFKKYLQTGGYLSAINMYAKDLDNLKAVYNVYRQWIISDFIRKGKDKNKLIDLFRVLVQCYGSQLSFNKIAQESLGLSTETVINYIEHLIRLEALIVLQAFDQNKRAGFPRKNRRFHFSDPFIAQTIVHILKDEKILKDTFELTESSLVESAVIANYQPNEKLFYIKAEGEVDLVVLTPDSFIPIEVKWTNNFRENELRQILKYPNGLILSKQAEEGSYKGIKCRSVIYDLLS